MFYLKLIIKDIIIDIDALKDKAFFKSTHYDGHDRHHQLEKEHHDKDEFLNKKLGTLKAYGK